MKGRKGEHAKLLRKLRRDGFTRVRVNGEERLLDEEIVLPKTSSNVFISTNIDSVLRNLATRQLIVAGFLPDQCVNSAVRDACDLGYLVTMPTDACATLTQARHDATLDSLGG